MSASKLVASEVFEGPVELVYEFTLFFFAAQDASPRLLEFGQVDSELARKQLSQGKKLVTRWQCPVRFVVDQPNGPVIIRTEIGIMPVEGYSGVTWTFSLHPVSLLGRILSWRERRHMKKTENSNPDHRKNLLRLKWEFEHREKTGIAEAFGYFREQLRG